MAEQRQPFRFRLPWLAPPQPTPAAPRPSQVTQAVSQPPSQRPPFRPAGVAPTQPPPPARTESPTSSRSSKPAWQPREARLPQGPPGSLSHIVPQIEVTSRPASPAQVSSELQQTTKALPQLPSSSRGGAAQPTGTKATTATLPTLPQAKVPSPTKKPPTKTTDSSLNPEDLKKRETSKTPSEEPKSVLFTIPAPELQKKQASYENLKKKTSTTLSAEVSSPKPEPKPHTEKENYTASYKEPKEILKGNHSEPKKEAITDREVIGLHTQTKAHPLEDSDEQGQHSEKEVFDIKEVFKKTEYRRHDTEKDIDGHERVAHNPHKHRNDGGQKAPSSKKIKDLTKFVHKQGTQREKQLLHEKPLSIVTLNGENIGATMELSSSIKKDRIIPIHRGYKLNPDEIDETTTEGERSSRKWKSGDTSLNEEFKSYVNNNVQGINNSLIFNSTMTERNPGVHLNLSCNPAKPMKPGQLGELLDCHKAEVPSTPAEKLKYAPNIRRRCLRSLLESSDTDPEKPRRHGC